MRVTVLGCGSSGGVPQIDTGWGACDPQNPKNRRLRPSILVQDQGQTLLIDTSPDLRQQLLSAEIKHLDAILYTHGHADHTHGLDDLRPVNRAMKSFIPIYADPITLAELQGRFGYAFQDFEPGSIIYRPWLKANLLEDRFSIGKTMISTFEQDHGWSKTIGYRLNDFAYSTDVRALSEQAFDCLKGVKVWIIGCLSDKEHPTHASVGQALDWIARVKPQQAYITHMGVGLDYDRLKGSLPPSVQPAYDGLHIEL